MSQDIGKIATKITIHPSFLGPDLEKNIEREVRLKNIGTCSRENGYVTEILSVKIGDLMCSGGNIVTDIEIVVQKLVPKIGSVYTGTVVGLTAHGAYVKFGPMSMLCTDKDKSLKVGSTVRVRITDTKYNGDAWMCICTRATDT